MNNGFIHLIVALLKRVAGFEHSPGSAFMVEDPPGSLTFLNLCMKEVAN